MKKLYVLLVLTLLALAFVLIKDNKKQIAPSGLKIKVGIIAPLSGKNMGKGMMGIKGIKIAQQLIPYLQNGDEIEWVAKDDQDIPEQSVKALKTLIEIDKVTAVIMLSGSNSVFAISKIVDQYKTPILTLYASHPEITKISAFVNQFNFDDNFQASVAALYIRDELLLDSAAIITQSDNIHLFYLANQFAQRFKAAEGEITNIFDLNGVSQNTVEILQEIKHKAPQILYLPVDISHIFEIKLALNKLNWNPTIMLSDGALASARTQHTYPLSLINGALAIDAFSYDTKFTHFGKQLLDQVKSMQISHTKIGTYGALGMEGYALLIMIMNQCTEEHNLSICINNRIRSTTRFEGIKGFISFDPNGKAHRSLAVNKLNAEEIEFVVQVY